MSQFDITVEGGTSVRLPTAGKYCPKDILVTATGGGGGGKLGQMLDGTITELTEEDFSGVTSLRQYAFYWLTSLKSVVIPDTVTTFNSHTFYQCTGLENFTLPQSLSVIKSYMFYSCKSLVYAKLHEGITNIQSSAFYGCEGLKEITIPSTMSSIATSGFSGCKGLAYFRLKSSKPPTITSSTFTNVPVSCVFSIPPESKSNYTSATNWSSFATSRFKEEASDSWVHRYAPQDWDYQVLSISDGYLVSATDTYTISYGGVSVGEVTSKKSFDLSALDNTKSYDLYSVSKDREGGILVYLTD